MTRSPIRLIVKHELRLLWRGRTIAICVALLGIMIAWSAANGAAWVRHQRSTIAAIELKDAETYTQIKAELATLERRGNPRPTLNLAGMAWYLLQPAGVDAPAPAPHIDPRRAEAAGSEWVGARHAVLPPAPLGALAIGQSDLHPYYSRVTIRTHPVLINSDEIENPANLMNGRFDLAFVLTFCWPLVVLPIVYNLLADEREHGTLALVRANPISLRTLLLAKVVARGGVLLSITIVFSVIALIWIDGIPLNRPNGAALALWSCLVLTYGMLWFGLAAWVNSAGWRSGLNAMVMVAAWLAWVVVLPSLINTIATSVGAVPSRVQLINEVRTAGNLNGPAMAQLLTTYSEEHPDVAPAMTSADTAAMRGLALQDETDRRIGPVLAAYRAARADQQALVDWLRFLSPAILAYQATSELAGTSSARYQRFADQLDAYHRAWRDYFYPLAREQASLAAEDYDRAPRFKYAEESPQTVHARVIVATLAIGLIAALMLALGIRRLGRDSGFS